MLIERHVRQYPNEEGVHSPARSLRVSLRSLLNPPKIGGPRGLKLSSETVAVGTAHQATGDGGFRSALFALQLDSRLRGNDAERAGTGACPYGGSGQ